MSKKPSPEVMCLFCGRDVEKPQNILTEFGEVIYGRCPCLAVYVCDPTGHNIGEAYMEALAILQGNWLLHDPVQHDYKEIDYDWRSHTVIYNKTMGHHAGKLIFLRKVQEYRQSDEVKVNMQIPKGKELKKAVKKYLLSQEFEHIVNYGKQDKSVIRILLSMSYDKQDILSYRSIQAMGLLCKVLGQTKMDIVRDTIRKLLWSMGDESGGIGWSAAEMIAEIVRHSPRLYEDIIPVLWSYKEEEMFRAGVVLGMCRIALADTEIVRFTQPDIAELMFDDNPLVRAYSAILCKILDSKCSIPESLQSDNSEILVYVGGELMTITVAEAVNMSIV